MSQKLSTRSRLTWPGVVLAALLVSMLQTQPASAVGVPIGLSPSGTAGSGIPTLTWSRVAGATSYAIQASVEPDFGTTLFSTTTTNRRYVPRGSLPVGTVWWRVQARTATETGGWATTSYNNDFFPGPTLIAPPDGASLAQPDEPLLLSWSPVPGAISYTVEIDDSPGFPNVNITASNITTTSYVVQNAQVAAPYYWHVRAVFDNSVVSNWSEERSFEIEGLAPPTLVRPADDPTVGIQDVVLQWTPVPGATKYEIEVSVADSFNTKRESRADILGTTFSPTLSYWNDQYFWHVRAIDAFGNKSDWGPTWRFKRDWPDQPIRQYPAQGSTVGKPFFFQWTAVPHAVRYAVFWKAVDGPTWTQCNVTGSATTVHTTLAGCGPTVEGDYEWRVQFWDDPGPSGNADYPGGPIPGEAIIAGSTFHYDPEMVEPSTPGPVVTGLRVANSGIASQTPGQYCAVLAPARCDNMRQTPVLRWNPMQDVTRYQLVIANDAALTNVVETRTVDSTMYTRVASLIENQATDGYYWQVQPCPGNVCPNAFDPSQHRIFNKKSNLAELVSPADKDTVETDVVNFVWRDWLETNLTVADLPQDHTDVTGVHAQMEARQYRLLVSTVPNFQSTVYTATVDEVEHAVPTKLLPEGVLYWRVIPIDGTNRQLSDSGPYSASVSAPDVRTFTKSTSAPTLKVLNGGQPLTSTVPLEWNWMHFGASYNVEVYKNDDTLGQSGNRVATLNSKQIAVTLPSPLPVSSQPYRWRVQKVDASNNKGPWSSLTGPNSSFLVVGASPTQTFPASGARVVGHDSYFSWTAVPGAKSYRFERRAPNAPSLAETPVTTPALAWAPTSTIPDGTWQWRVVAVDTGNKDMGASPWRTFTVDGTRPTVISYKPLDGSVVRPKVNFVATFSEPVTNVNGTTVRLFKKGAGVVAAKVTLNASKRTVTLNPTKNLARGKKYTLKISSGVRDLSGLQAVPKTWKVTVKK